MNANRGHEYLLSRWNTKSPASYFTNIDRFRTLSDIALLSTSEGQWFKCSTLAQEFIFINHCNVFPHHSTPMAVTEVLISSLFWMWCPISSSQPWRLNWLKQTCGNKYISRLLSEYPINYRIFNSLLVFSILPMTSWERFTTRGVWSTKQMIKLVGMTLNTKKMLIKPNEIILKLKLLQFLTPGHRPSSGIIWNAVTVFMIKKKIKKAWLTLTYSSEANYS